MLNLRKIKTNFEIEKESSFFLLVKDCVQVKPTILESKVIKYWDMCDITYLTLVGDILYVDYLHIWSVFENIYGMTDNEIERLIKRMAVKYFNLHDIIPEIRY